MSNNRNAKNVKNMVICSTLNQITNYLVINRYRPERVFNIVFDEEEIKSNKFNINIKPNDWDKYLKEELKKAKYTEDQIKDINITQADLYNIKGLKETIVSIIEKNNIQNESIYWHITGGQRILSLAMCEIAKDRKNDRILYLEGNTEKLIKTDFSFQGFDYEDYGDNDLTINQALRLVGFKSGDDFRTKSKKVFIEKGEFKIDKNDSEYLFYNKLIKIIREDKRNELRDKLLECNTLKCKDRNKEKVERQNFIKKCFSKNDDIKELYNEYEEEKGENKFEEFSQSYPAGYIFEKLMAYSIYRELQNNLNNIIAMETSLKTYFKENEATQKRNYPIDEIDIILLTNSGKLINFECKSGDMDSNNAKSHNYTTYRLSGVFGMPILMSPLYEDEINCMRGEKNCKDDPNTLEERYKNSCSAIRAAKRTELQVCAINGVFSCLKNLNIIK